MVTAAACASAQAAAAFASAALSRAVASSRPSAARAASSAAFFASALGAQRRVFGGRARAVGPELRNLRGCIAALATPLAAGARQLAPQAAAFRPRLLDLRRARIKLRALPRSHRMRIGELLPHDVELHPHAAQASALVVHPLQRRRQLSTHTLERSIARHDLRSQRIRLERSLRNGARQLIDLSQQYSGQVLMSQDEDDSIRSTFNDQIF
jgi:hypothetical protein